MFTSSSKQRCFITVKALSQCHLVSSTLTLYCLVLHCVLASKLLICVSLFLFLFLVLFSFNIHNIKHHTIPYYIPSPSPYLLSTVLYRLSYTLSYHIVLCVFCISLYSIEFTHRRRSGKIGGTLTGSLIFDSRKYPGRALEPILCTKSTQTTRCYAPCFVYARPGIADHSCKCTLPLLECGYLLIAPTRPEQKKKFI